MFHPLQDYFLAISRTPKENQTISAYNYALENYKCDYLTLKDCFNPPLSAIFSPCVKSPSSGIFISGTIYWLY